MSKPKEFGYAQKITTSIWSEDATSNNPYLAEKCRLHGYDVGEIIQAKSYSEVLFLTYIGEFPNKQQQLIFERLLVGLMHLGPRENATRAAMVAGIGKANHEHILPIGLNVAGGEIDGAKEVENAIKFFRAFNPEKTNDLLTQINLSHEKVNERPIPGMGAQYGDRCPMMQQLAHLLLDTANEGSLPSIELGNKLISDCNNLSFGWLATGIAAATLYDLGFGAREGAGVYQLIRAPGILAHGLEQTHKPISAMPLLEDDNYELE